MRGCEIGPGIVCLLRPFLSLHVIARRPITPATDSCISNVRLDILTMRELSLSQESSKKRVRTRNARLPPHLKGARNDGFAVHRWDIGHAVVLVPTEDRGNERISSPSGLGGGGGSGTHDSEPVAQLCQAI